MARRQVVERDVDAIVFVVVIFGVAMAEGAPGGVLAAQTHRCAFEHQASEGECFREGPVNGVVLQRRGSFLNALDKFRVQVEIGGKRRDAANHLFERGAVYASGRKVLRHGASRHRTQFEQFPPFLVLLRLVVNFVEALLLRLLPAGHFLGRDHIFFLQPCRVNRRHRFVSAQLAIEDRLRIAGVVVRQHSISITTSRWKRCRKS